MNDSARKNKTGGDTLPPAPSTDRDGGENAAAKARNPRRDALFVLVAVVLVFALIETGLRVAGFRFVPVPVLVDKTWGRAQLDAMNKSMGTELFQRDPLLFWSMKPGAQIDIRRVNDLGLLNKPIAIPKPRGVYRVLCLGDSCTAIGPVAYPMVLQKRLEAASRRGRRFEVINAGVFSYTSLQGLRLFRDRLSGVRPDLVTIYYGWNDHYLAAGYPDKMLWSRNAPTPLLIRLLRHLRLYQLVERMVFAARMEKVARMREERRLVRVAPEDYRRNIGAIVDLARKREARPLLLTAPSNHRPGHVPAFFVQNRLAESEEALIERHRRYNQIVREVAAQKKADLLDLEKIFQGKDGDALFLRDGVHPNARGRHLIGELLVKKMGEMGVLSKSDLEKIAREPSYDSLDPNILRDRIEFLRRPLRAAVGKPVEIGVRIKNTGDTVWLAHSESGCGYVRLGVIVFDGEGRRLFEKERGPLPRDVRPGETVEVHWTLSPFDKAGRYVLEVDPVSELVTWFDEAGDERTTEALIVEAPKEGGGP